MKQNNISTQKGRRVFSRRILFFLFLILAVIALVLGLNLKRYTDRERKQDNIEKEITTEKEKTGVRKLHKKYKDMIGWLEIKGTGFSYPVMQTGMKGHHPDDWQYYLHRDVHGGYSFYGTPFLDVRCRADSDNRIIYGHNINGRRYFGYLQNFREEAFFMKHPVLSLAMKTAYANTAKYLGIILSVSAILLFTVAAQTCATAVYRSYNDDIKYDYTLRTSNGAFFSALEIPVTDYCFGDGDISMLSIEEFWINTNF